MQAIVLKRADFREFDQIISVYTKERGKLEALARGVKKITSKNAAHLEPFCFAMIEIAPGRELDHLTKVVPLDLFVNIRRDLNKSLVVGYMVSFLGKMVEVEEADIRMWELTLGWLKFVNELENLEDRDRLVTLIDGYIINLFGFLGFAPVLEKCVVCGKEYQEIAKEQILTNKKLGFYFSGGGLICANCILEKTKIGEEILVCGLKEINDMQLLMKGDWRLMVSFEMSATEQKRLHGLVYEFVIYHSEEQLRDWANIL